MKIMERNKSLRTLDGLSPPLNDKWLKNEGPVLPLVLLQVPGSEPRFVTGRYLSCV